MGSFTVAAFGGSPSALPYSRKVIILRYLFRLHKNYAVNTAE
jgi:hypothetical protein